MTPSETPGEKPGETPGETPSETPVAMPVVTPVVTPVATVEILEHYPIVTSPLTWLFLLEHRHIWKIIYTIILLQLFEGGGSQQHVY